MEGELYRPKTFISTTKLIKGLNLVNSDNQYLRVVFNDVMKGNQKLQNKIFVKVLSVALCSGNEVINKYDMLDIFKIADGINVWLDTGKQLKKVKFPYLKNLMCIDINLSPKSFTNNQGLIIKYYPIVYKPVKACKESENKMRKLERELENKEIERVNNLARNMSITDDEDEEEIDVDFF